MVPRPLVFVLVLAVSAIAHGEAAKAPLHDSKFLHEAAQGGLLEVELGNLVAKKAMNPQVKEFGQRMVTDHSKVNDQLKAIAEKHQITLATTLDKAHVKTYDRFLGLDGDAFDRAYMATMVRDHTRDVKEFDHEAKKGRDADLKSFAANTLPTLRSHLQMAREIEESLGQGVGGSGRHPVR